MLYETAVALGFASVLLAGATAGVYLAFSISVMPALDAAPPASAIASMQAINRRIQNPVFFAAFFGVPVAAGLSGALFLSLDRAMAGGAMLAAAAVYLLGSLLPTIAVNVPLNNRLDKVDAQGKGEADTATGALWQEYSRRWTLWNTLRAIATFLSLLLAALGLFWLGWAEAARPLLP